MTHQHGHTHKLGLTLLINIVVTAIQFVVAIFSNSLALLSDAIHNFSDILSLAFSYYAQRLSYKEATADKTFGYKRAEILVAMLNTVCLFAVALFLIEHALMRLMDTSPSILSTAVMLSAGLGILVNGYSVFLLKPEAEHNLNLRSAYWHLLGDMLSSIAVLVGGLLMALFEIFWIDSVLCVGIALYLLWGALSAFREALSILMHFSPAHINLAAIENKILAIPTIRNIHHVHIWKLTDQQVHFEAHLDFKDDLPLSQVAIVLAEVKELLAQDFSIPHSVLQPEIGVTDAKELIVSSCHQPLHAHADHCQHTHIH